MDYKTVSTYLNSIPSFTGEQTDLHPLINAMDVIQPAIQNLPELQKHPVAYQIIGRLSGNAKEVINALPNSS